MVRAGSLSLGKRIALLVALSLALVLALFGFLSLRSLQASSERELRARLVAAQLSAHHIDNFLRLYLDMLHRSARTQPLDLDDGDREPERRFLEQFYSPRVEIGRGVFLMDGQGRVVWGEPASARSEQIDQPGYMVAAEVTNSGQSRVSDAFVDHLGRRLVALGVPVLDREGRPDGALVLLLDLSGPLLGGFVQQVSLGQTGYAEIVDSQGLVLASSNGSRLFQKSDHTDQFAAMIRSGRPTVGGCHSCHEENGAGQPEPDILAFAPLAVAPWGVALRQSEEEVLAPTRGLQRSLVGASILSLLVAVGMAWVGARVVVRPIRELTGAAQRIAAGDLENRVEPTGPAEIGELAREFDAMRDKLRASLHNLEQVKAGLELRVDQRTRQLSALLDQVIVAQEEERRRLARELHDDTCQSLAALAIRLEALEETLPESAGEARGKLAQLKAQVRATLGEVRALALNLRPSVLDDLGLMMAIDWYAKDQLPKQGLEVRLELDAVNQKLPPSMETVLFRITQEALNNVVKHSGAASATVRLSLHDSAVVLEVEDDGVGFDVERVLGPEGPRHSLGLHSMRERASLSGGFLTVLSSPGCGTRIRVELPLQRVGDNGREEDIRAASGRS